MNKDTTQNRIPLFVSLPHSGLQIPHEAFWLKDLPPSLLMCDVDAFVDDLYKEALEEFQIPFVFFEWHRYAVDANRRVSDVSPQTVRGVGEFQSGDFEKNPSDIHWYKSTKGDLILKEPITKELHKELVEKYWKPFHQRIKNQFQRFRHEGHKKVYLIDLHSMPGIGKNFHRDPGKKRPEVVISDNEGRSCSKEFRDLIREAYKKAGFQVELNWPYKGGSITQDYGKSEDQEVLQVELNRSLYMDENTKKKKENYKHIQEQLRKALSYVVKNKNLL